jgi:2-methylisocitrate lyase-like PEP mutase family enzyme
MNMNRNERLRELLSAGQTLIMPDAYDAISARIISHQGFQAIQCSGRSISLSLCLQDEGMMTLEQNLEATRRIVSAVDAPVMADGEDGYGDPAQVEETIQRFLAVGVAGINIEDQVIGAEGGVKIVDRNLMIEKLQAAREAARSTGNTQLVINGRTDALRSIPDRSAGLREAINRANAYLNAGADLAFVTYIATLEEVETCIREIHGPVSIAAALPYNIQNFTIDDLCRCGVARVSLPTIAILSSIQTQSDIMREIYETKKFKSILENSKTANWTSILNLLKK